jgi:hypothetical protein
MAKGRPTPKAATTDVFFTLAIIVFGSISTPTRKR